LESIIEATVIVAAATILETVSRIDDFSFYASLILDYTVDSKSLVYKRKTKGVTVGWYTVVIVLLEKVAFPFVDSLHYEIRTSNVSRPLS
jgi:hypothetical protein